MKDVSVSVANECHNSITVTLLASIPLFQLNYDRVVMQHFVAARD
jgi:hypothetical protein